MTTGKSDKTRKALKRTAACVSLSTFYFALLAWPFGLTESGFMVTRALLAGLVMFAISVPALVIVVKKDMAKENQKATSKVKAMEREAQKIGQLAINNRWLSPSEVREIMYCQKADGKMFGQVAVKRNFLSFSQVKELLDTQSVNSRTPVMNNIDV